MMHKIIKICGIQDADMAKKAVQCGVDLIGLVFHPASPRYVTCQQAVTIAETTIQAGAVPVAVFVDHSAEEMQAICDATHIKTIQLHGDNARAKHHLLPAHYQRIYVENISDFSNSFGNRGLTELDSSRDFILIDHKNPGLGNRVNLQNFHYKLPFRLLLAGGLTPDNVIEMISTIDPDGVDVSSGVESARGLKSLQLIQQFVAAVRGHDEK